MKHFFIVALGCITASTAFAQWPTSTPTDSALQINYGFAAHVLTFDDGSSIFSHGVYNSVYLTKLDTYGNRVWPQPVIAHYNDTSDFGGGSWIVSDVTGGAIVQWNDHRGADTDPEGRYLNNALYVQRVDNGGVVRWTWGGVQIVPARSGAKFSSIVTDGAGGVICAWSENGFGYPGAPNKARLVAARLNAIGQKIWEIPLDSLSVPDRLYFSSLARAGRYVYVQYYAYYQPGIQTYVTQIVDTAGNQAPTPIWIGYRENVSWRDSILFSRTGDAAIGNQIVKLNTDGDTLWNSYIPPFSGTGCRFLSVQYSILKLVSQYTTNDVLLEKF